MSGTTVTYTLVAGNLGPSTATDVVVTDPTPPGLASPVVSDPCAGGFPCNLGSLSPGAQVTITVTYTVVAAAGTVTNTATISSPIPDPNPDQNTSSVTTEVTPAATTTTVATTTTSVSTTSTPVTTTTTTGNEICNNCVDDDGDGLIDNADPDCCTETGTFNVTRVRIVPRHGNASDAKLRVTGTLDGASFSSVDPRQEDVSLLFADGSDTAVCCTITSVHWMRLFKKTFGFWDQLGRICPPIIDTRLSQKRTGGAGIVISSPHFDATQLVGSNLALTVRVGGSCATSTVQLRRVRNGRIVFP